MPKAVADMTDDYAKQQTDLAFYSMPDRTVREWRPKSLLGESVREALEYVPSWLRTELLERIQEFEAPEPGKVV